MHEHTGRSGCTPAEPYPPSCESNLAGKTLNRKTQTNNNEQNLKSVTYVLNQKCYLCIDPAPGRETKNSQPSTTLGRSRDGNGTDKKVQNRPCLPALGRWDGWEPPKHPPSRLGPRPRPFPYRSLTHSLQVPYRSKCKIPRFYADPYRLTPKIPPEGIPRPNRLLLTIRLDLTLTPSRTDLTHSSPQAPAIWTSKLSYLDLS